MQLLIKNYCHFLIKNNSTGKICYESLQEKQNDSIRKRYGQIYHSGTMFYPSNVICKYLNKNMEFKDKQDNITGLQIADFVPNDIARYKAGISCKYKSSHKNIRARLYDGEIDRKDRIDKTQAMKNLFVIDLMLDKLILNLLLIILIIKVERLEPNIFVILSWLDYS